MLVALLSDAHNHLQNLSTALEQAKALGCSRMIYLGDFVHSSTLRHMMDNWTLPLDFVLGNNEYEFEEFSTLAATRNNVHFHGYYGTLTLGERRVFFTHTPHDAIAKGLNTGKYDSVFYGHTHAAAAFTSRDKVLMINPGELYGRREKPGFAVYYPASNTVTFHQI